MLLIRQCTLFACIAVLTSNVLAQNQEASRTNSESPWAVDRSLSVSPQGEPSPVLSFRLLPPDSALREGNAVPIYLRLEHEQSDARITQREDIPKAWNALPISELPLREIRDFLRNERYFTRQLELGARRRVAEWNYTLEEPNPIGLLLPDVQSMRNYGPIVVLQARAALAEKDYAAAGHHLQTGFAFSRHVGEGPTLIHGMIAMRIASQCADTVGDFIEQADSPNLYWALTALPRPLIDLTPGLAFEYQAAEKQFPILTDLEHERSAEQWAIELKNFRQQLRDLDTERKKLQHPEWFPQGSAPDDPPANSPDLGEARKFVAGMKHLPADQVNSMPPAQVLLLYIAGTFREDRDDWHKAVSLPYAKAGPLFRAAAKRLGEARVTEGHILARIFLPALDRVIARQNLLDRQIAALRVVEAIRIYAAAHDGKLPDELRDVGKVPVPDDPGTGRPFEFHRDGDAAVLVSQIPGEPPDSKIRYRVIVRSE
jgi:hypothetical protein